MPIQAARREWLPGGGQLTQRVPMVTPSYSLPRASAAVRTHKWDHMFSWISLARRSLLYSRSVSGRGGDGELRRRGCAQRRARRQGDGGDQERGC
jgi:hypothetical protein